MSKKNKVSHLLRTHLLRMGAYVAIVFWLAFTYGGWELVSTPETGRHSHLAGWTILALVFVLMIATMNGWVKYLSVIFGGGILGGILTTGSGLLNGKPFPRLAAATFTALLVGCSVISQTFTKRKLTKLDRAALIVFVIALVSGMVKDTPVSLVAALSVGFGCLLLAWLRARFSTSSTRGPTDTTLQH